MRLLQLGHVPRPLISELAIANPIRYFLPTVGQIPLNLLYGNTKSAIFILELSGGFPALSSAPALQLHSTTALPHRVCVIMLVSPLRNTSPLTTSYVQSLPMTWVTGEFQPHTDAVRASGIQSFQLKKERNFSAFCVWGILLFLSSCCWRFPLMPAWRQLSYKWGRVYVCGGN